MKPLIAGVITIFFISLDFFLGEGMVRFYDGIMLYFIILTLITIEERLK